MIRQQDEWMILGLTLDGKAFTVPDWVERLCNSLARTGGDGRKAYSSYIQPVISDGLKCVAVRASLQGVNTPVFEKLKRFVDENQLMTRLGHNSRGTKAAGSLPDIAKERRDPSRIIK